MDAYETYIITFTILFPLMLTQMVRSIKRWQHTLLIDQTTQTKSSHKIIFIEEKGLKKSEYTLTTYLRSFCLGNRDFLKYCGVSRYFKIRTRKEAPLSLLSAELISKLLLLSNTTI